MPDFGVVRRKDRSKRPVFIGVLNLLIPFEGAKISVLRKKIRPFLGGW
jgi:hypothetical protein